VTALLLLHVRQGGGNSVEHAPDIDVNLPIPFLHLEELIGAMAIIPALFTSTSTRPKRSTAPVMRLPRRALRDIGDAPIAVRLRRQSLARLHRSGPYAARPVRPSRRVAPEASPCWLKATAGSGDDDDLVCNI